MSTTILITGDTTPILLVADLSAIFDNMSFRPQTVEKHIYQNDTPTINFVINESGAGKNLNGLTLGFAARLTTNVLQPFVFNVTPNITDASNGLATVTLSQANTSQFGQFIAEVSLWGTNYKQVAIQFPLVIDPPVS